MEKLEKEYDVVIVGGGPAGYCAALYCARANLSCAVIEKFVPGGQMGTTDKVDNYPGFEEGIGGYELSVKMQKGAERFGVETIIETVTQLELKSVPKKVKTAKAIYHAKVVILATGASPRALGLENEKELIGRGVSYCATCDGMFFKNKEVVVVGGGNTAVADALYLAKICAKVSIVHRRDSLRASKTYMNQLKLAENVEIIWNSTIQEIQASEHVEAVKVKDKDTCQVTKIACSGIFVAVGNVPNSELLVGQVELNESGYVLADETTRTNIPGVFAIGDIREKQLRQIVTAVADGAVASHYAEEYLNTL